LERGPKKARKGRNGPGKKKANEPVWQDEKPKKNSLLTEPMLTFPKKKGPQLSCGGQKGAFEKILHRRTKLSRGKLPNNPLLGAPRHIRRSLALKSRVGIRDTKPIVCGSLRNNSGRQVFHSKTGKRWISCESFGAAGSEKLLCGEKGA